MTVALSLDPDLPLAGLVSEVPDAVLMPPMGPERPQSCGVFAKGQPVLQSQCFGGSAQNPVTVFPAPLPGPLPAAAHLQGRYFFGGVLPGHFGHMLVEGTSRLWALKGRDDIDAVLYFARPFDKTKVSGSRFAQMAALLGLPPVIVLTEPTGVGHLVVAEQGLGAGELMNGRPEARAYLREKMALVSAEGQGRRLYITRSGQPARRGMILAEASLETLFAAQGYEIILPEAFTLQRQVAMFRGASHVVGTEGSPFHLLALAGREGCKVAVIQRRRSVTFGQICEHLEWFIGGFVTRIDTITSIHAPKKTRNSNFIYLEPSRAAMWQALAQAGFVAGAAWGELTPTERQSALNWLETETGHRLLPAAVQDLPEDDGDAEKDAA